ncbi:ion transporter [Gilvimarinus polysaccharolyticus]|uniref:ion transporter n=1 Tax=Gilvimarinus polysaccharolyticus TaxID=863921 RepID=UPI000A0538E5|nr:ion transporter [Gilvimarinus polysaccharolyticus]
MLRKTWRHRVHVQLEPTAWGYGLSPVNWVLCTLILLSLLGAILETEPRISVGQERLIRELELLFSSVFMLEYLLRLWVCVEDRRYQRPIIGRLRYLVTPAALIDLVAVLPLLLGFVGAQSLMLRFIRLLRVARLAQFGKLSRSVHYLFAAIASRRYELSISVVLAATMILFASIMLYLLEKDVQPEAFGSIPRAMWWAIITFTTVGYGDVYPITQLGRVFAALSALASVAMVAMPTGIMAAAFSDAMQRGRHELDDSAGQSRTYLDKVPKKHKDS